MLMLCQHLAFLVRAMLLCVIIAIPASDHDMSIVGKTFVQGFRQGDTQNSHLSYRDQLKACIFYIENKELYFLHSEQRTPLIRL